MRIYLAKGSSSTKRTEPKGEERTLPCLFCSEHHLTLCRIAKHLSHFYRSIDRVVLSTDIREILRREARFKDACPDLSAKSFSKGRYVLTENLVRETLCLHAWF